MTPPTTPSAPSSLSFASICLYALALVFVGIVIVLCFGGGNKKKLEEGLKIKKPKMKQLKKLVKKAVKTGKGAIKGGIKAATGGPKQPAAATGAAAGAAAGAEGDDVEDPEEGSPSEPPASTTEIELPERLKGDEALMDMETAKKVVDQAAGMNKLTLLLVAKEIKRLIEEQDMKENELIKLTT